MLGLVKEFPHLKVVLQDLPAMIQQGNDVSSEYEWKNNIGQLRLTFAVLALRTTRSD